MPTYDLQCRACGHRFERFVMRMLREDDRVCPECGSHDVKTGFGGGIATRPRGTAESMTCVPRGGFG